MADTLDVAGAIALVVHGVRHVAPGPLWVQGEVMGLVASRAGHWYWSLSGNGVRLSACALRREATVLSATLARAQITGRRAHGTCAGHPQRLPRAWRQVQLRVCDIDPAMSIGAAVLARRQVGNRLGAERLLGRQHLLEPPPCPLRLGVVAPAGQGLADLSPALEATPVGLAGPGRDGSVRGSVRPQPNRPGGDRLGVP